jgi:hypothetical protein
MDRRGRGDQGVGHAAMAVSIRKAVGAGEPGDLARFVTHTSTTSQSRNTSQSRCNKLVQRLYLHAELPPGIVEPREEIVREGARDVEIEGRAAVRVLA